MKSLDPLLKDREGFLWVAEQKKFAKFKPGKYEVKKGISNNDLINLLRSGNQVPVRISFNNQNTLQDLAGRIATQIEADSTSLINTFTDADFLQQKGITGSSNAWVFYSKHL